MAAARRSKFAGWLVVLTAIAVGACAGPAVSPRPVSDDASGMARKEVWVVSHGWHTRVAVRGADVDSTLWPESRDFGEVAYLEVGWGDRDFYPKPEPSVWDAIDAVVRATPAALHVGALDAPPHEAFGERSVVRLSVPAAGIDGLARFIAAHYERDAARSAVRIAPGYYPRSAFYRATGRYHALAYNSNRWAASALQAAGAAIEPGCIVTSGALMRKAAAIAREPTSRR